MSYFYIKFLPLLILGSVFARKGYGPGEQDWGFVNVRPGAHMFYWLHYTTANITNYRERPLIIWLQGGPFCSSTGLGNFEFLGPLDVDGNYRTANLVETHNVLFIDSPVGAGFSYVDDEAHFVSNNSEIARDLVEFMKSFYKLHPEFEEVSVHIFSESYGGKMAPEFALELYKAKENNEIKSNLQSVSIGNPFTSPVDTLMAMPSVLLNWGIVDEEGYDNLAENILEFLTQAGDIDYLDVGNKTLSQTSGLDPFNIMNLKPRRFAENSACASQELLDHMRGRVAKFLNISNKIEFSGQSLEASENIKDMFKSAVHVVKELLNNTTIKVNVYSGQLDLVCSTLGTIKWINRLSWNKKESYVQAQRKPFIIDDVVQGYEKSGGNLAMYWINRAGHSVFMDNLKAMRYILKNVTNFG